MCVKKYGCAAKVCFYFRFKFSFDSHRIHEIFFDLQACVHTWYLSFFLHAHILSHENFTLGKCVNLRQNCQKQYFSGSSGIFLHSAKNFTRTAFAAFVTNIRYAYYLLIVHEVGMSRQNFTHWFFPTIVIPLKIHLKLGIVTIAIQKFY